MRPSPAAVLGAAGTIASGAAGVLMGHGVLAAGGWTYLAGAGLELAGGRLAGRTTRAGAFLGSAVDRVAELLVLGGLATTFRDSPALLAALAAAGASMLVSYARARGEALGAGEAARGGSFQRLERTAGIGLPCALAPLADAAWGPGSGRVVVAWGLAALAALTALSAGRRTTVIYRTLRAADPAPADRAPSRLARALHLVPARSRKAAR